MNRVRPSRIVAKENRQWWRRRISLIQSSPILWPEGFVVKKGVKRCEAVPGSIPHPLSSIVSVVGFDVKVMEIKPVALLSDSEMLSAAFLTMLTITCSSITVSAMACAGWGDGMNRMVIPDGIIASRKGIWREIVSLRLQGARRGCGSFTTSAYVVMNLLMEMHRSWQLPISSVMASSSAIISASVSSSDFIPAIELLTSWAIMRIDRKSVV